MKIAIVILAAAVLASCARPNSDYVEIPGISGTGPTIPHPEWQRIEKRFRQASYPRPALGLLSDFDSATVGRFMSSPFVGQSRQFSIGNSGFERRTIGMILDRDISDASRFAAILCGEATDPSHAKIISVEISGVLPKDQNKIGNHSTVIFRSR